MKSIEYQFPQHDRPQQVPKASPASTEGFAGSSFSRYPQ